MQVGFLQGMPTGVDAVPGIRVRQGWPSPGRLPAVTRAMADGQGHRLGTEELGQQGARRLVGDATLQEPGFRVQPVQGAQGVVEARRVQADADAQVLDVGEADDLRGPQAQQPFHQPAGESRFGRVGRLALLQPRQQHGQGQHAVVRVVQGDHPLPRRWVGSSRCR